MLKFESLVPACPLMGRRTVRITEGKTEKFRADVLAPVTWSDTAVSTAMRIWARKMPGATGVQYRFDDRTGSLVECKGYENSIPGMVHRVVNAISHGGVKHGYFDAENAVVFAAELTRVFLGQYAMLNTPAWINVGVQENPQSSACFILDVQDSLDSLRRWQSTETALFSAGSGAGADLSALRPENYPLSGGGSASGPVSFARGTDAWAGVTKSGGKSRRAAKMLTLSITHPDVSKFITCKRDAQRRAHTLIDAGYSGAWQSDTWQLEPFQNANLSVRAPDDFMRLVEQGGDAPWEYSFAGQPAGSTSAKALWQLICECAHESGDPGLQFSDTINMWHTVPQAGWIQSSNPCSEYLHLQNSACNLSSINLLKFVEPDGGFGVELFRHVARLMIIAQDIIVEISGYPTPEITENSKNYRPLGLGHCNGGALLMRAGIPYDSDEGRDRLAAITSLMAGTAYAVSAELAQQLGPFAGYAANRDAMLGVIRMHSRAANVLAPERFEPDYARTFDVLAVEGAVAWAEALQHGKAHGYRNSQATLLAPTGTIGIVMDCDTTGIEPEYDLITYKSLASGGVTRKVSGSVSHALRALGFDEEMIDRELAELERDGICSLPTGRWTSSEVLKTAAGQWPLSAEAHIRMCAAVQPFLSGGISKTVNLPNSATVEDVSAAYLLAWKLGVKCVALYRDGCKRSQPLNSASGNGNASKPATFAVGGTTSTLNSSTVTLTVPIAVEPSPSPVPVNSRRRPPKVRQGRTEKLSLAGHDVYLTVNYYPDGKTPCELFVRMAKWGSTEGALMDALCQSVSIGLQHGVPLASFIEKWQGTHFAPAGFTGQEDIRSASSVLDLFAKVLARPGEDAPTETTETPAAPAVPASPAEQSYRPENLSPCCGATYRTTGSCKTCTNCGTTSGGCG
jgi:ribonucleoside-diphosphate reductase alpha chain